MVSMVPVFFLEVKSNDKVLDMCAAPGSKTAQILEFMGSTPTPGTIYKNKRNKHKKSTQIFNKKKKNELIK